jgi:hypothetical protein
VPELLVILNGTLVATFHLVSTQALLIDSSQNATFAGTISSGAITSTGGGIFNGESYIRAASNVGLRIQTSAQGTGSSDGLRVGLNGVHAFVWQFEALPLAFATSGAERLSIGATGTFDFKTNNLTNIGTISSGAITTTNLYANDSYDGFVAKIENDLGSAGGHGLWVDTRWNVATNVPFKITSNSGTNELFKITGLGAITANGTISSGAITSSGAISGTNGTFSGSLALSSDGSQLQLGTGNRAQIFHNSAGLYMRTSTGPVYAQAATFTHMAADASASYLTSNSAGTTVNGTLTVNGDANSTVTIGNAGTNATKIYAGSGDELYVGANNTYKLRFKTDGNIVMDNGGNLGIGTSTPVNAKLEIESSADQGLLIQLKNTDQDSNTYMRYKDWAGQYWDTGINWANNDYYLIYGGTTRARFTNAGGLDLYGSGNSILTLNIGTTAGNYSALNVGRTDGGGTAHITPAVTGGVPISGIPGILLGSTNTALPAVAIQTPNSGSGHIVFNPKGTEKVRITADGNVGIGTDDPKANLHVDVPGNADGFAVGGKNLSLNTSYQTGAQLEVTLGNHQGCYVKVFITGDWSSHSAMAFLGEYFIQNGADAYAEPGMIIREVENTNGIDSISSRIYDGGAYDSFQIQFKLNVPSGASVQTAAGNLTYQIMGQFDAIS